VSSPGAAAANAATQGDFVQARCQIDRFEDPSAPRTVTSDRCPWAISLRRALASKTDGLCGFALSLDSIAVDATGLTMDLHLIRTAIAEEGIGRADVNRDGRLTV